MKAIGLLVSLCLCVCASVAGAISRIGNPSDFPSLGFTTRLPEGYQESTGPVSQGGGPRATRAMEAQGGRSIHIRALDVDSSKDWERFLAERFPGRSFTEVPAFEGVALSVPVRRAVSTHTDKTVGVVSLGTRVIVFEAFPGPETAVDVMIAVGYAAPRRDEP